MCTEPLAPTERRAAQAAPRHARTRPVAPAVDVLQCSAETKRVEPATLPTHQVGSRHAGCATPAAFRHRKHAHERRARAPLCQLIRRSAVPACMKRSGAGLPLCTWSGCGGRLNGVVVATVKRDGSGDAPHRALSRCASINAERVACSQCCRVHWAPVYGVLDVAPVCGLLDVVRMSILFMSA